MKTEPLSPDSLPNREPPDEAIEVFNNLIKYNWTTKWGKGQASFSGEDVLAALNVQFGIGRAEAVSKSYLDVKGVYEALGWSVRQDRPAIKSTEKFPPNFVFSKRKKPNGQY